MCLTGLDDLFGCFASGSPAPSCSMARSISGESSRRAAFACRLASEIHGPRSVRKRLSLSLGTTTTPMSSLPSRKAAVRWIMSTTSKSDLAETWTSTPIHTLVPFALWHFVQSISPTVFLVQPPASANCLSRSFRTAAPPLASVLSFTRSVKLLIAVFISARSGPRPSRSMRSLELL